MVGKDWVERSKEECEGHFSSVGDFFSVAVPIMATAAAMAFFSLSNVISSVITPKELVYETSTSRVDYHNPKKQEYVDSGNVTHFAYTKNNPLSTRKLSCFTIPGINTVSYEKSLGYLSFIDLYEMNARRSDGHVMQLIDTKGVFGPKGSEYQMNDQPEAFQRTIDSVFQAEVKPLLDDLPEELHAVLPASLLAKK